ncbi:Polypeptide N-acetylgalactosaminyltransferase 2 [Oopsacas minuta]|uniref:Polypeptide N-acetylgalactosaminyltransferase 2 n=1 Tax=Oopsacas minuta TaxID=111878 RepID=A0AAV7K8T2_9METZ|nr:Polypeptide N-acetylgalactosaminyltransferase 2 [Oopsacas minuta]
MYLFIHILFLCHFVLSIIATESLQWNVDFKRNTGILNETLVPTNDSALFIIKIQDNNDFSSSIQFQSVLQLVQPLLTLKYYLPHQSQSSVNKILPSLCLLSDVSIYCDASPDVDSILQLCTTHRLRSSLNSSLHHTHLCTEGAELDWVWVAEFQLPHNTLQFVSIFANIESNSFGIDIPTLRLHFLVIHLSTLANRTAVNLQLVPFSLPTNTHGNLLRSFLLAGNVVSLWNGDILFQQQDHLYSLDWKYGMLWIERSNHLNYTLYKHINDESCALDLAYEEREPHTIDLYSLDNEKGDIKLMGEDGTFKSIFTFNLWDEMGQYLQPDMLDNSTILSFLRCWVRQEILVLVSNIQSTKLITFDLVRKKALKQYKFPQYLPSQTGNDESTLIHLSSNNPDTNRSLIIRDMKVLSNTEVLLWGSSLLYSPDCGNSFYFFSEITDSISQVDILPTGRFIVVTQQHQMWHSSAYTLQLQQLFIQIQENTTNLYQLITDDILELTTLSNSSKPQVSRYQLLSVPKPSYSSSNCSSELNSTTHVLLNSSLLSPDDWITTLTSSSNSSCPFSSLSLLSPHCVTLTRELHQFVSSIPDLSELITDFFTPYPVLNCTRTGEGLPQHFYLDKSSQFNISLIIHLLPYFSCLTSNDTERQDIPQVFVWFSRELLEANSQLLYHPLTHTLTYSISLTVNQSLNAKLLTGDILASSEIKLKISPSSSDCTELNSKMSSTVFIGCPSSLSIMFDKEGSENNDIWIKPTVCDEQPNLSCLFFDFGFTPHFYIYDELQDSRIPFKGYYNLKPVAAGLTPDRMINFSNVTSPLGLWAVTEYTESPLQLHTQLAAELQWLCIHDSFCADIHPNPKYGITAYYLTLEFSNSIDRANTSFCNFTTQFTVLIYGITLGPMGTIVSFVVSLVIYLLILICGYPIFLFRDRIKEYYTIHIYNSLYGKVEHILTEFTRIRLNSYLRKRSNKVKAS